MLDGGKAIRDKCQILFHLTSVSVTIHHLFSNVLQAIQLLPVYHAEQSKVGEKWESEAERVITFCHQCATKLVAVSAPDTALKLFLNCAQVIDRVPIDKQTHFAYEFFSQVSLCAESHFFASLD